MFWDMTEDERSLADLKEDYFEIHKKYNLPEFDDLNKDFFIERICEVKTDYLIREVKRFVGEKLSNYLRFIESLLNPSNSPMFVFSIVKLLGAKEKSKLAEIYKQLVKTEVSLLETDINFSEERDAKFIKDSFGLWQEIKIDLLGTVQIIKDNWDNKSSSASKGYFG